MRDSRARLAAARSIVVRGLGLGLAIALVGAGGWTGGEAQRASARPASAAGQDAGLEPLAFMAGCWAQEGDGLREQFTAPTGSTILGMSRFVVDGEVVQFEFHRILATESGPVLTPHPSGVASVPFAASTIEEAYVVFENPEHDFPQRILYDGRRPDTLLAAIEGERDGRTVRRGWPMIRVACGAASP